MITIPANLPPTTAPCPMCGQPTTSPGPEQAPKPQQQSPIQPSQGQSPAPVQQAVRPVEQRSSGPAPAKKGGAGVLWALAGLTCLGLLAGAAYMYKQYRIPTSSGNNPPLGPTSGQGPVGSGSGIPGASVEEAKATAEAAGVLRGFFEATTAEEKAKYVIGGASRVGDIRDFYGPDGLQETSLEVDGFTSFPMDESDRERGIFLMDYYRPRQFQFDQFFRPIATMEIQMQVEAPGIHIWPGALTDNFEMDSQRVRAFFKKIDGEYKLDWDTLVQTQFRLLRDFYTYPVPGRTGEFRVFVVEDVTTTLKKSDDVRVYRLADAAHLEDDQVTVEVEKSSTVGQLLEPFAWTNKEGKAISGTTATVKLRWTEEEEPRVVLDEIVCWEFLGVGGERGNTSVPRN
ncbi:MAG: hypothetical protein ACSHYF_11985 [Verrucomicrobiaceae bacterium]